MTGESDIKKSTVVAIVEVPEKQVPVDQYTRFSPLHKSMMLCAAGLIALLTPFTDTIYLPALDNVQSDLQTTPTLASASVSTYMACVGVGQLIFGTLSDRYGRRNVILVGLIVYEAFTIGCIFSPNINTLIGLRAVEGLLVAATVTIAPAIMADIFAPEERGTVIGKLFIPILLGPVIAPLIGGYLAAAWNWRATFVCLALLWVPCTVFFLLAVPETLPRLVSSKYRKANDVAPDTKPAPLVMPWTTLAYLFDPELAAYYAVIGLSFGGMFTTLTILPIELAQPPYTLASGTIGLCFLPMGFASLFGSMVGGVSADMSSRRFANSPDGRMTVPLIGIWLLVAGLLGFGFSLENGASLGAVLGTQVIVGFAQAMLMPSTMSFLQSSRHESAGAVGSVMMFLCFGFSAIMIGISVPIADATSISKLFIILAALNACAGAIATLINVFRVFVNPPPPSSHQGHDDAIKATL